jgi:hypothetical protein
LALAYFQIPPLSAAWMLITFAIIVIWIALSWWSVGGLLHIKPSPRCRLLGT